MDKFIKKLKDGGKKDAKKEVKKEKVEKEKKAHEEDEEEEPAVTINVEVSEEVPVEQPKVVKAPVKQIDEAEIAYTMERTNEGKKDVRVSWVPQQGGIIKKFDLESEKDHFVSIGEAYTPPVQQKNSNFLPIQKAAVSATTEDSQQPRFKKSGASLTGTTMEKTPQQKMEEEMEAQLSGLRAPTLTKEEREARKRREEESKGVLGFNDGTQKIPQFTKGNTNEAKTLPFEKSQQQKMEEEMAAKQGASFQATFVSREQREAKEAERKRRDEEAAKIMNFGTDNKPKSFVSNKTGTQKLLQKTPQQLREQEMDQQLKASNLAPKVLTKEESQIRRQKMAQREEQKKQEVPNLVRVAETPASGLPKFTNSKKNNSEQPVFTDISGAK